MKTHRIIVSSTLLALAGFGALAQPAAPTQEQVRNANVRGIVKGKIIKLSGGTYEGAPFVHGGAERPRVTLLDGFSATGNLDASPEVERVVLLTQSSGGSGVNVFLAVFVMRGERVANLSTVLVGDEAQPSALTIGGGMIFLDIMEAGPGDAACCPTRQVRKTYRLGNRGLEPVTGVSSIAVPRQAAERPC